MPLILVSKQLQVRDLVAGCHGDIHYTLFTVDLDSDDLSSDDEFNGLYGHPKDRIPKHGPPSGKRKKARHIRGRKKKSTAKKQTRMDYNFSDMYDYRDLFSLADMISVDKGDEMKKWSTPRISSKVIPLSIVMGCILFLTLLMIPTVEGHLEETYAGYDLIERPTLVDTGNRVILLKDVYLRRGHVLAFHAIFDMSLVSQAYSTYFQIWRRAWIAGSSARHILIVEKECDDMIHNYTMNVEADNIRVEEGDRLGVMVLSDKFAPIHASQTPEMTGTIFHKLDDPNDLPQVHDFNGIEFDGLEFPYTFSIGVTYEPDEHTEGIYVGEQGSTGATGPQGVPGELGATGYTGATGVLGLPGQKGEKGTQGERGSTGLQGRAGPFGDTGATGPIGDTGATGPPGDIGIKGDKGDPGTIGATGVTGHTGSPGATGGTGATGPVGVIGDTGATGIMGSTGATGPQGPVGATGSIGPIGVKGNEGFSGEKGRKGDRGQPGEPGPDLNILLSEVCSTNTSICEDRCVMDLLSENHFHCECRIGFEIALDGHSCKDIDECSVRNGGCQTTCLNTIGSYQCACASGLKIAPDGHTCIDILECDFETGNCEEDEICLDLYGNHVCIRSLEDSQNYIITNEAEKNEAKELIEKEDNDILIKDEIIIGLFVWIGLLTLVLLIVLLVLCCQRQRMHREKKLYRHYAEAMRRADHPQQPAPQPTPHTPSYLGSDLAEHTYAHY